MVLCVSEEWRKQDGDGSGGHFRHLLTFSKQHCVLARGHKREEPGKSHLKEGVEVSNYPAQRYHPRSQCHYRGRLECLTKLSH